MLLLTGAALGDRFGRRRVFTIGIGIFTAGSIAAALAPSVELLNVARAVQGVGGAIVMPLTLTILSAAVPPERRGLALGAWGGIAGLAVAFGPLVGGAVVAGHLLAVDLLAERADRPRADAARLVAPDGDATGPRRGSTCPASAWSAPACSASSGALVRGNDAGLDVAPDPVRARRPARLLVAAFVLWELRDRAADAADALLPQRERFTLANLSSLLMFFGMFGSIFLLSQFFQTVQDYSPLRPGLRILPWTLAPMFIAPVAGAHVRPDLARRRSSAPGLALQSVALAWMGLVIEPDDRRTATSSRRSSSPASAWRCSSRPMANVVLGASGREEEGKASGVNNAIRELGGVFGVAVLAVVFAHVGGYGSRDRRSSTA